MCVQHPTFLTVLDKIHLFKKMFFYVAFNKWENKRREYHSEFILFYPRLSRTFTLAPTKSTGSATLDIVECRFCRTCGQSRNLPHLDLSVTLHYTQCQCFFATSESPQVSEFQLRVSTSWWLQLRLKLLPWFVAICRPNLSTIKILNKEDKFWCSVKICGLNNHRKYAK